jgi:hypothetical protein
LFASLLILLASFCLSVFSHAGTPPTTSVYTYNARNFLIDEYSFGPSGPQSEFGATSGSNEMQYDAAGNLTSMKVNDVNYSSLSGTTSYTYNSLNQLTQESSSARNGGYTV